MRITGGTARGRNIAGPKAGCTLIRPTSDRVREALFNIIRAEIPGSRVLDLYAGTGALGLEALSRGASCAVFVDQSRQALELIQHNLERSFSNKANSAVAQLDLAQTGSIGKLHSRLPADLSFELIFLDPPYEKGLAEKTIAALAQSDLLHQDTLLIAEERKNTQLAEQYGKLQLVDHRSYGETSLWLYRLSKENRND